MRAPSHPVTAPARPAVAPAPTASGPASIATAEPSNEPGASPDEIASALDANDKSAHVIDRELPKLRRTVEVEGEDATSAFATVRWESPSGSISKTREAWNGGCCSAPVATDRYFAERSLIREVVFISPRTEADSLLQGREPRSRIELRVRDYARDGRVVRERRDAVLDNTDLVATAQAR
ncbi:MAG: hypothetical protein HY898_29170 [Deltaproteobacteria bacterium]|nr:hypothetical protein [Deltaproteobacteria bacterium]